jgi:hypothetical protein
MKTAGSMLRRAGRPAAGALPAALLPGLGLPALGALVFLAVAVLAVTCWVIASRERTDRVSQMMLARRGQAGGPEPGAAAPPVPASRPTTAPDGQGGRPISVQVREPACALPQPAHLIG